jgi:hypothetical protein
MSTQETLDTKAQAPHTVAAQTPSSKRSDPKSRIMKAGIALVGLGTPFGLGVLETYCAKQGINLEGAEETLVRSGGIYLDMIMGGISGLIITQVHTQPIKYCCNDSKPSYYFWTAVGVGALGAGVGYVSRAAGRGIGHLLF